MFAGISTLINAVIIKFQIHAIQAWFQGPVSGFQGTIVWTWPKSQTYLKDALITYMALMIHNAHCICHYLLVPSRQSR